MSLKSQKVPKHIRQAFAAGLGDFITSGSPLWSVLLNKNVTIQAFNLQLQSKKHPFCPPALDPDPNQPPPPLSVCDPNSPCYVGSWQTLPDDVVQSTGWRFLAAEGDLYGAGHVGIVSPPLAAKLTGFVNSVEVLTAIESYNELPNVALPLSLPPGDFELRILRITWLHLEVFWLYALPTAPPSSTDTPTCCGAANNTNRGTDVIVPYIGFVPPVQIANSPMTVMTAYLLPDFLNAICPQVQKVCKQSVARQVRIQQAQARQFEQLATAITKQAMVFKGQASSLGAQAKAAADAAALAKLRASHSETRKPGPEDVENNTSKQKKGGEKKAGAKPKAKRD